MAGFRCLLKAGILHRTSYQVPFTSVVTMVHLVETLSTRNEPLVKAAGIWIIFLLHMKVGVDWLISPYIELFYLHAPLFKYYVVQILKTK